MALHLPPGKTPSLCTFFCYKPVLMSSFLIAWNYVFGVITFFTEHKMCPTLDYLAFLLIIDNNIVQLEQYFSQCDITFS